MGSDEAKVLDTFRQRFRYDRGLGRLKPVTDYQRMFRGFDDAIAAEFTRLSADAVAPPPPPVDRSAPAPQPSMAPPADPAELGPRRVGRFRILSELGRGGQGSVHLAEDTHLHRQVALKILDGPGAGFGGALERFRREAKITAKLDHPGICTIYEAGEDAGVPWIAMRHVDGEPLSARIDGSRASRGIAADSEATSSVVGLPPSSDEGADAPRPGKSALRPGAPTGAATRAEVRRVCRFVERTARALHVAHTNGLVHRDIKPGNVMVTRGGDPVVLDFGLARDTGGERHTITGALLGTPLYMSPEQLLAHRGPVDSRSDVWSLGVTLFECLTLRVPFNAPTREGLYHQILATEPQDVRRLNPAIPRDLAIVVQTALQKDRDRRYRTALDLAEDLRRVREDEPIRARPASSAERLLRWTRRNSALAASVAGLIVALAAGLAVSLTFWSESETAREGERAQRERALADAARQSELNDVRALRLAVGTLCPRDAESVATAEDLLSRAGLALENLPARKLELSHLRTGARSGAGASSKFADPTDAATHRVLTELVTDGDAVSAPGTGELAVLRRRFTAADAEDAAAIWSSTIAEIADPQTNPAYGGLRIQPQWGLRPLGRDSDSRLFEFAHVWSGSVPERRDGRLVSAPDAAIVFVLIPGGSSWLGASGAGEHNVDAEANANEGPVHEVTLRPYFLSKYECTQAQWERLSGGALPSYFHDGDTRRRPVENVSWDDCVGLRRTGWLPLYGLELPTEAQWEHACRAGSVGKWTFGDDATRLGDHAWDATNSRSSTHPVGEKQPNAFGLHDVHGNVFEWAEDVYADTYDGASSDGSARETGDTSRAYRGGGWNGNNLPGGQRAAFRNIHSPGYRASMLGLRAARPVAAD